MVEKYTFKQLAKDVLEHEGIPLSSKQIWEKAKELGLIKKVDSSGQTPERTIGAQIYVELRNKPDKTIFTLYSNRPSLFFIKNKIPKEGFRVPSEEFTENILEKEKKIPFLEKDLHNLLVRFFSIKYRAYIKTLNQSNSIRAVKGINEWIHPDLVGVKFPFDDYEKPTLSFQNKLYWTAVKFFSFEMKRELTPGNCKEYFFQAVSNSSWANEGYLVALLIDEDNEDLMRELKRLSNSFGIGVIKLTPDSENEEAKILFPARVREVLDWETINNLIKNKDFEKFLELVETDIGAGKITYEGNYDAILDDEEFKKYLKDKKIL
jgi:hypothetical protein